MIGLFCFVLAVLPSPFKAVAYNRFEQWCHKNGRLDLFRTTPDNRFGTRLREVAGFEHIGDYRPHGQPREWVGMRLRKEGS
jgi:hypothetical protein